LNKQSESKVADVAAAFAGHRLADASAAPRGKSCRAMIVIVVALALGGCAGMHEFRPERVRPAVPLTDEGLTILEERVKAEPQNAEHRIALANHRAALVWRYVRGGEAARKLGQLGDAEKSYRQALAIDPNEAMARDGLEAVIMERRNHQGVMEAEVMFKRGGADDIADASERLRSVLAADPNNKEALNLKAHVDETRANAAKPESKLAATYKKPITLEFRDAPLKSVFDVIAKVWGLNFIFDKEVRPDLKVTIFARNTTVQDAVHLLLVTNQLEQKVLNENSILIFPNTPQKLKDYQPLSVRTFYVTNADVKAVANTIKTLVKTKDLVIDERVGMLMMRDTPEAIRAAERIVALQDVSDPEVMLEVEVMEIKRARLLELGIQWPGQLALSPLAKDGKTLTLEDLRHLSAATTQATIGGVAFNARGDDQDSGVLANPRIRVRNKDKAKILIGDRVPVITTTSTSTGFVSESVNYVDVGLKLEVEPNVYLDEEVGIKVNLEVSSLVREVLSKSGTLSYQIGTRGAITSLRLKDGETQILAGLINDEDRSTANRLPGLSTLPVLGRLFKSQKDDRQRTEILLSITPRILRALRRPGLATAEFESGTETNFGAQPLVLNTVELEQGKADATRSVAKTSQPVTVTQPTQSDATAKVASSSATQVEQNGKPASRRGTDSAGPVEPNRANASVPDLPATVSALDTKNGVVAASSEAPPAQDSSTTAAGPLLVTWQAPRQVRAGEQFNAVLRISSETRLRGSPMLLSFDPQLLQAVGVDEGDFFRQGAGETSFSHRVDLIQGKVFVAVVRRSASGEDISVNGTGNLVSIAFKALRTGTTKLQLDSISPEPAPSTPIALPIEHAVRIVQ
jgi:general secretion pathway protein D